MTPEPGLHPNIDFPTYRSWEAVNSGVLRWGKVTSKHLLAAIRGELDIPDSKALKFGRAHHVWILEGEEAFRSLFKVSGSCCAVQGNGSTCGNNGRFVSTTPRHIEDFFSQADHLLVGMDFDLRDESESGSRYYQKGVRHVRVSDHEPNEATAKWIGDVGAIDIRFDWEVPLLLQLNNSVGLPKVGPLEFWYCGVKGHRPSDSVEPVEVIDAAEFQSIQRMHESIRRHPINFHLRREGFSEISALWEAEGVLCKCRIDRLAPPQKGFPHLIIDLKKMRVGHGSRYECEKEIANRMYHIQARMNVEAVQTLEGVDDVDFVWVFIEDGPPYDVQFIVADDETMRIAEAELSGLRRQYSLVSKTPEHAFGYSDSPLHIAGAGEGGEDVNRGGLPADYRKRFYQWEGA